MNNSANRGFTIVELMVVAALMVLLGGLVLPNWRAGQSQLALQRAVHKVAQDVRRVQEFALAARQLPGGQVPYAYGIYFLQSEPNHYIIFADLDSNDSYNAGTDVVIEDIRIESPVSIVSLSASPLTIAFRPPRPTVAILPSSPAFIRLAAGPNTYETCVNSLGLIEVARSCGVVNNPPVVSSCSVFCVAGSPGCISSASVKAGISVQFTLLGDASDDKGIAAYCWGWGDGTMMQPCVSANPVNGTHTYSAAGTYYPNLYVTDAQGAKSGTKTCNAITVVSGSASANLGGYAWSENIGWVNFCPNASGVGPVGSSPACGKLDASNELKGWAQVVSTGGWISLNCADDPNCTSGHKVRYNSTTGEFSGWAWAEDFGWISFNCSDTGTCGTSNYKVLLNPTTNEFEGWAWSENIGWISFNCNNTGTCSSVNYKVTKGP